MSTDSEAGPVPPIAAETIVLLTVMEAAKILRVSRTTMYRLIREKRIEVTKVSESIILLTPDQISAFVEASKVAADATAVAS